MNQNFYTSEELDHILTEIKEHQRMDMLLRIDEILTFLDAASPTGKHRKTTPRHIQLIEGKKLVTLTEIPAGSG